ncbi:hypothetical protein, partial [Mesorhizobium humile]
AAVLLNAVSGSGPFAAPRSEMLKEVLVRAASNRWGGEADDVEQRKVWGPWLKQLFAGREQPPIVKVDGEIVIVKLRSTEAPRSSMVGGRSIPITARSITEPLAEELFGKDFVSKARSGDGASDLGGDNGGPSGSNPPPPTRPSAPSDVHSKIAERRENGDIERPEEHVSAVSESRTNHSTVEE